MSLSKAKPVKKASLILFPLLTILVGSGLYVFTTKPPAQLDRGSNKERLDTSTQAASANDDDGLAPAAVTTKPDHTSPPRIDTTTQTSTDVMAVGLSRLSDEEFLKLQAQLVQSDDLLQSLLEEFRNNTNPQRAKQLIALLGEHNTPGVLQTAAEMVYSGDPVTQKLGLDLLSRLQPQNAQARDMAIELLSAETDPTLIVATMNVLATPSTHATEGQRDSILDNTSVLSNHENANVRSHSIELIGRWNQSQGADMLTAAIDDPHPQVRARAVSALRGLENPSEQTVDGLLRIAENTGELKTTRQSALYTLRNMPLSNAQQQRYNSAQISVRTRQQTSQ